MLANPVLVGAVTVLVTLVAVFLAYNANNGLPFVPTTTLKVQLTNGYNLVPGNEVRSGGYRVGVVSDLQPITLPNGTVGAEMTLKLDKKVGQIPNDSSVEVRPRSALGLKYVELTEGKSKRYYADGDTLPATQTRLPVDLDQVYNMFDAKTRDAVQTNLQGFGDSFTGRGQDLGRTIDELPRLMQHLEPVMHMLSLPETDLKGFLTNLQRTASTVAPVSKTNAHLFTTMANTFQAIGSDPQALKDFIHKSPPTEDVSIDSMKYQQPFLRDLTAFSLNLQPATRELRAALPTINDAIDIGIPVQRRFVDTNQRLEGVLAALRKLSEAPATMAALRGLSATVQTLNPQLRFYGPYVTVCNYWNYFWTMVAEHFSEPDTTGYSQRALINFAGRPGGETDSLGAMGATHPANGTNVQPGETPQYLQGPVYSAAVTKNGAADCEQGQRGFLYRNAKYVPQQYHIQVDSRSPGAAGPTYKGLPRVPAGETFTNIPETGPYKNIPSSETGDR